MSSITNLQALHPLIQLIETQTGLALRVHEHKSLQLFVNERLKATGLANFQHYYNLLRSEHGQRHHPVNRINAEQEWNLLLDQVTTGESYFWRDHGQIKVLAEQVLPKLIEAKRIAVQQKQASQLSLRLWSAGCSTGEEAYTLAIMVRELLPDLPKWQILILGTDLNPMAITKAKQGIYKQWSFRQTPVDFRSRHFQKVTDGWQVKANIRAIPRFQVGNLQQDPFPAHINHLFDMDLILCRNVFIYFPSEVIANILEKFYATLHPGGYLICGHAELQAQDLNSFRLLSFPESMVYQRPIELESAHRSLPVLPQRDSTQPQKLVTPPIPTTTPELVAMLPITDHGNPVKPSSTPLALIHDEIHDKVQTLETYFQQAQTYANQAQYPQAIEYCQAALEINPEARAPLYLLVHIAEEQGDVQQAKTLLKKIIYLHPEDVTAYIELGELYVNQQHLPQAIKTLHSAQLLLRRMSPETELDYRGKITVRALIHYTEQLLRKMG